MARAALALGVRDLARMADMSPNTIARLEAGAHMHRRTLEFVRGVLESAGVVFIDAGAKSFVGGEGVRLGQGPQSAYARLFQAFDNLPDRLTDPKGAYDGLLRVVGDYIDIVESERREPDSWERLDLNEALHHLDRSDVLTAHVLIWRAITPPDNQSKDYPIAPELIERSATFTIKHFRDHIAALRARGYMHKQLGTSWHRVDLRSSDVVEISTKNLIHGCLRELLAARCFDAEILHGTDVDGAHVYFFSPSASARARETLTMFGATPCAAPGDTEGLRRVKY
jgi:hypothetical protein